MKTKIFKIYVLTVYCIVFSSIEIKALSTIREKCQDERPVCDKKSDADCKTKLFLYTRRNKNNPEPLHKCDLTLPDNTYFNSNNPTEVVVHGFAEGICSFAFMLELKEELLKRDDYNVILVDWTYYALGDYINAIRKAKHAVEEVTRLIDNIKHEKGVDYKTFHLIGHSLGAHFCGLVGQKTEVYRITGLDPAGPGYYQLPEDKKLSRDDAKFVDVIHTNAGRCYPPFGYLYPMGDEDFYVEGGSFQLSCYNMALESILKFDTLNAIISLVLPVICSHQQSIYYFKSTINAKDKCCFRGKLCDNYKDAMTETMKCKQKCCKNGKHCSIMGIDWQLTYKEKLPKQRIYTVRANNICPYCTECVSENPKVLR